VVVVVTAANTDPEPCIVNWGQLLPSVDEDDEAAEFEVGVGAGQEPSGKLTLISI
jgi:hypothetical protein